MIFEKKLNFSEVNNSVNDKKRLVDAGHSWFHKFLCVNNLI